MERFLGLLLLLCIAGGSLGAPKRNALEDRFKYQLRIVNGTDALIDQIPFQVSMQFFNAHTCGGAILTQDTILTAAHCLDHFTENHNISVLSIRVGSSYLQREGTVYGLREVIIHDKYDPNTYDYDIAILKLSSSLTFSNAVQPVILSRSRVDLKDDELVQVSGWGRIRTGGPLAETLQKINMPVLNQQECARIFTRINTITDRMFCAGHIGGDGDSCNGDSGGPLVNRNNVLYGLVSWGPAECAAEGYTGVYTNVAHFHEWIRQNY